MLAELLDSYQGRVVWVVLVVASAAGRATALFSMSRLAREIMIHSFAALINLDESPGRKVSSLL